ncbi:MAG: RNA degradosome polyphosphate kinase, partial [Gemmatimonadaceae bacterium]
MTGAPLPYLNRELSWLSFNSRVLSEATDPRVPLLERLKFLSIFSTNLDEFYMVRLAGLRRRIAAGAPQFSSEAQTPAEQFDQICSRVNELLAIRRKTLREQVLPALAGHGIGFVSMSDLSKEELAKVDEFFESQVFPVLTPLAVDPGH